jgi:hypothetical protein
MTTQEICDQLRELQQQHVASKKAVQRIDLQCRAMARCILGWTFDMSESDRKKLNAKATAIVKSIRTGKPAPKGYEEETQRLTVFVRAMQAAIEPLEKYRTSITKQMRALASQLPVAEWADAQAGFSCFGVALIVGEAGNLSDYPTVSKLWKRLGLAVLDGCRQGNPGKDASAEMWIAHGYCRRRRSTMWNIGDALVKQGNGYRDLYLLRKEIECEKVGEDHPTICRRGPDPETGRMRYSMHCNRRAQRYMEKRLLRDLWQEWKMAES